MHFCYLCNRYFVSWNALHQHEANSRSHNTCRDCEVSFPTKAQLVKHYSQSPVHSYCSACDEHFDDDDDLEIHCEDDHFYCIPCRKIFNSQNGLEDHGMAKHPNGRWFCRQCDRFFKNELSLTTHKRFSEAHNPRTQECPGEQCNKSFIRYADLVQHLESGACACGVTRQQLNKLAIEMDTKRVITNPRLLKNPGGVNVLSQITETYATERSFNGWAYECMLCRRTFSTLSSLNAHLASPAHDQKIYRCPRQYDGCGSKFKTLSGIMQHAESGSCEIYRYQATVTRALDDLSARFGKIGFH